MVLPTPGSPVMSQTRTMVFNLPPQTLLHIQLKVGYRHPVIGVSSALMIYLEDGKRNGYFDQ